MRPGERKSCAYPGTAMRKTTAATTGNIRLTGLNEIIPSTPRCP